MLLSEKVIKNKLKLLEFSRRIVLSHRVNKLSEQVLTDLPIVINTKEPKNMFSLTLLCSLILIFLPD